MSDPTTISPAAGEYKFTNDWFQRDAKPIWDQIIPRIRPQRILEIGSFEGASTCYLIDKLAHDMPLEIHCVDSREGGVEHGDQDMGSVESRFRHNVKSATGRAPYPVSVTTHKGYSDIGLAKLLADGKADYFDFVYVDASHQAPDVLCDAVLGFRLLKVHGFMAFDDYLWFEALPGGKDPLRSPKMAVDAFVNIYIRKINIIPARLYQLYVQKTAN